ncbi:MAG: adenylate/guanylate cyclase domain-containing protein, partial [Treponemataceae bacterium]|nr:adenylate/guanylate cyclase domain-containing protein [Treponemataceae bacterium]
MREHSRIRFPIGAKLAVIIGLVVLISLGTVTILNSYFIGEDVRITAENGNLATNARAAIMVNDKLGAIRSNVFQLLDLLAAAGGGRDGAIARQAQAFFFERNQDIAAVLVLSEEAAASGLRIENPGFFISHELERGAVDAMLALNADAVARSCMGEAVAKNISPFFQIPAMALFFPWRAGGRDQSCVIAFSIESVSDILG